MQRLNTITSIVKYLNRTNFMSSTITTLIAGVCLSLISCGGGSNATQGSASVDIIPPYVVETIPASETTDVQTNVSIVITFSEKITGITRRNVSIYPLDFFENPILEKAVSLELDIPSQSDVSTTELTVIPSQKELQLDKIYQITLSGIKDIAGNVMVDDCTWIFSIIGLGEVTPIGIGNTGVCGKPKFAPADLQSLTASAGDGKVIVKWVPPKINNAETYSLEYSTDAINFTPLVSKLKATTFNYVHRSVLNTESYKYRIISKNKAGVSNPVESNVVNPRAGTVLTLSSSDLLLSKIPTTDNNFGYSVAFSPDGKTLAVGELRSNLTLTNNGFGTVQLFKKSLNSWISGPIIANTTPELIKFSPDGVTLAVAYKDTVDLFITEDSWETMPLTATTIKLDAVGVTSIAFNSDGSALAVGLGQKDFVQIYLKSSSNWNTVPNLGARLISQLPPLVTDTRGNGFGQSIAFGPDDKVLLVGEFEGDTVNNKGVGTVQFFLKTGISWGSTTPPAYGPLLLSQSNSQNILFGTNVLFSPDGSTLMVTQSSTTFVSSVGVGTLQFFKRTGVDWTVLPQLESVITDSKNIGYAMNIAISPDNSTIAVLNSFADVGAVQYAGIVHIYNKVNNVWISDSVNSINLISSNPTKMGNFGGSIEFSPDNAVLVIGERRGGPTEITTVGTVSVFDRTLLN